MDFSSATAYESKKLTQQEATVQLRVKKSSTRNISKKEIRKQTDGAHNRRTASEVQQAEVPHYWKNQILQEEAGE